LLKPVREAGAQPFAALLFLGCIVALAVRDLMHPALSAGRAIRAAPARAA
jgi:hypothetical protein